jgi:hypothetical protein
MVFAIFTSPVSSICVARSLSDQHLVSSRRRPPNTGISIAKSERTRIQFDLHALCFAGLEIDLYESFEFLWGPGHAGTRIGDIYLRDLGPNASASVRYIEGNDVYPVRRLVVDLRLDEKDCACGIVDVAQIKSRQIWIRLLMTLLFSCIGQSPR